MSLFDTPGADAAYGRWQDPPENQAMDVIKIKDTGEPCDFCSKGHAVCQIGFEENDGRFHGYQNYCAFCAGQRHDVDVEPSKFDSKEEDLTDEQPGKSAESLGD